jgi:hypothetical protein
MRNPLSALMVACEITGRVQSSLAAEEVRMKACRADHSWTIFPLNDAVWTMFYYTQLYICAFSFVSISRDSR